MDKIIAALVSTAGGILAFIAVIILMYTVFVELVFGETKSKPQFLPSEFKPIFTAAGVRIAFLIAGLIAASYFSGNNIKNTNWFILGIGGADKLLGPAANGLGTTGNLISPLFSEMLRLLNTLGINEAICAILIAMLCFVGSAAILYKLVAINSTPQTAERAVVFLCLAPFAVLFGLPYHFSLTLFLILGTYYFAQTSRAAYSIIFGILAISSNMLSLVLVPCIIALALEKENRRLWLLSIPIAMTGACVFIYIMLQQKLHVTSIEFYSGLEGVKQIFSAKGAEFYFRSLPLLIYLLVIPFVLLLTKDKIPLPMLIYALILIPIPLFVKNCYAEISLLSFPLYIVLAKLTKKRAIYNAFIFLSVIICGLMFAVQMKFLLY